MKDLGSVLKGILTLRALYRLPEWLPESTWYMHAPFAYACTEILKPRCYVELGTQKGMSFCTFCDAMRLLNPTGKACAIDHWQGDEQTGFYDDRTFNDLKAHHDERYGSFSTLLKSTFDDANPLFADRTIDVLHIDGLHTYEAVLHDFRTWLPKMSRRGVILFHDTAVRTESFGVWRLWEEIEAEYRSLHFPFGYGLGVAAVGPDVPLDLLEWCDLPHGDKQILYRLFEALGERVALRRMARHLDDANRSLTAQSEHLYNVYQGYKIAAEEQLATAQSELQRLNLLVTERAR